MVLKSAQRAIPLATRVAAACIPLHDSNLCPLERSMKRRILRVDDELAILLTLKAILEINGFEVETAISAKEGIGKIKTSAYDMVITDMKMETEHSGYEVVRAAKKAEYKPATAILTAYPLLGNDWKQEG